MSKEPGTWLIVGGIVLIIIGLLANSGLLGWFGRLPGDIRIEREHLRFYFPITTMILLSVLLSALLYLFRKFW
jgi:membrane protein implicated in regulation of membrane protease activity